MSIISAADSSNMQVFHQGISAPLPRQEVRVFAPYLEDFVLAL